MTRCQCWRNQQGRGQDECITPAACRILAEDDGIEHGVFLWPLVMIVAIVAALAIVHLWVSIA